MRLIFLGPPGAGKGTQAQRVASDYSVPHISTGDILRSAVAAQTLLGKKAQDYMNRGELVPDSLVLDLVKERLQAEDTKPGWILDGFPRNVSQAEFLSQLLEGISQGIDSVINFDVPDDSIVARMLERGRKDDNEDTIRRRLVVYRDETEPLIAFYKQLGYLVSIDGNQSVDRVSSQIVAALGSA
ncbi:MAG: adenylate kinase [Geitlerinemataceae cyanobacterium]